MIVSSVCITIGISILVMVFCNGIISLFFGKIEADVFHNAVIYMMISALSFPFLALYNSCAALFRSMGNSQITLKVSVVEISLTSAVMLWVFMYWDWAWQVWRFLP